MRLKGATQGPTLQPEAHRRDGRDTAGGGLPLGMGAQARRRNPGRLRGQHLRNVDPNTGEIIEYE